MKKSKTVHVGLHILVPLIFCGISVLGVILTRKVMLHRYAEGADPAAAVAWLAAGVGAFAFLCGIAILTLVLRPMKRFVRATESLPLFPRAEQTAGRGGEDDLERMAEVFDRATFLLGKVEARELFPGIVGQSRAMREVFGQIVKVAPTDATVLIAGESGTGKELVASAICEMSRRKDRPFIKLNCVAIPEGLLESELFGHEKGAFTGAAGMKKGKFELADGGTVFLDEIGDMPLNTQAKLLRVLQEREFERVGGTKTVRVDIRFLAATNKDLPSLVRSGLFREDLLYRINGFVIEVPPLRARLEDVPALAERFLAEAGVDRPLSPGTLKYLLGHAWPGNVRELKHVLERAAVLADAGDIAPAHLPAAVRGEGNGAGKSANGHGGSLDDRLVAMEKAMIVEALQKTGGVQSRAARLLGINQRSLWHRVKKHAIPVAELKHPQKMEYPRHSTEKRVTPPPDGV